MDARCEQVMLQTIIAMVKEERRATVVFIVPSIDRIKYFLAKWKIRGSLFSAPGMLGVRMKLLSVWIVESEEGCETIPDSVYDRLMVCDAHRVQFDVNARLGFKTKNIIVAGVFITDHKHWFYRFARNKNVTRNQITYEKIVERFPDQLNRVPERTDPAFARDMMLKEDRIGAMKPFRIFARHRLKVATDKGVDYLNKEQCAEIAQWYGADWSSLQDIAPVVSFYASYLQKRYLAIKRMANARGKRRFLLLKYRRGGFSTLEQGLNYAVAAQRPGAQVSTIAHTDKSTERIFRIAKNFYDNDPKAPREVGDSKRHLSFDNGSNFFLGTAGGKSPFRGDTLQRVHGSEVAWWCEGPHQDTEVSKLVAGILGAASNGEIVFETTPNGREWFYHTYKEAKSGKGNWYPIFFRWFDDPANVARAGTYNATEIKDTLKADELELIKQFGLSIPQIAFRRRMQEDYKYLFPQEFPEDDESCFLTSGHCYFNTEVILQKLRGLVPPRRLEIPGGFQTIWEDPKPGRAYVAGTDTSEGIPGADPNGTVILDRETGAPVADLHGYFSPRLLGQHTVRLCRYYNDALLGVERQNHGHAVIQKVEDEGYDRPHFLGGSLFYARREEAKDVRDDLRTSKAGWSTDGQTRPTMLSELSDALLMGHLPARDPNFLGECLSFRLQSNGKFEADAGCHDDYVIKYAIAWQMRKYQRSSVGVEFVDTARDSSI